MASVIQVKRGTASAWTSSNPILAAGEIGFETDTKKMKVGDGSTSWTSLTYTATDGDISGITAGTGLSGGGSSGSVTLSIDSTVATLTGTQTLTNKTVNLNSNTLTGTVSEFNAALSDGDFATLAGTETLTNKTINLTNNTLTGTVSQFNTALSDGDFATLSGAETLTNKALNNPIFSGTTKIQQILEKATVSAIAATGTINYDLLTNGAVTFYTSNSSANWTINIRGDGSTTLNSIMSIGESLTIAFLVTNGGTGYYQTGFQIDGSAVTPRWQGGSAPSSGNANSVDIYSITIIKTANATFSPFVAQTRFG